MDIMSGMRRTILWWLRIVGWSLAGLAAGWIVVYFLPENYTSETTMRLEPGPVSKDFLPHESVDVNRLLERLRPTVLSRNVLTTIVNNFDLYPSERKRLPMEDVIDNKFRKSVRMDSPGANLIRVAVTYPNRLLANKITQDIASRLISENVSGMSGMAIQTVQFFQAEVDAIGKSLSALNARVKATPTSDSGYEVLALDRDQERKDYESLAQKLGTAKILENLASRGQDFRLELLDAASLPEEPDEAPTGVLLVGLACGFVVGLLIALRRALRRPVPFSPATQQG